MKEINIIFDNQTSSRLDVFVSEAAEISRSRAVQLIEDGNVLINGEIATKKSKIKQNSKLTIFLPQPVALDVVPENIPLEILYEDDYLLVVNKPKGMVVHPAHGNYSGTLVNALLFHCGDSLSGINGVMRPGIVHRIDKNTSGLLMVAKNDFSHNFLAKQIIEHSFTREYAAICYGNFKNDSGVINAPISRHPTKRKQMAVIEGGREAITNFEVIERLNGFTYLKLKLYTGRTHQIRVHTAFVGHPVAGDDVYGPKKVITELNGQCLHAKKLGFIHPKTNEYMEFESDLPDYFKSFLERKRFSGDF